VTSKDLFLTAESLYSFGVEANEYRSVLCETDSVK